MCELKTKLESENKSLQARVGEVLEDYSAKLELARAQQSQETKETVETLIGEHERKIAELKSRHLDDLKSQSIAQRAAMSSLRAALEKSKSAEIETLIQSHNRSLGKCLIIHCITIFKK
jgi:uncharacterized protein with von Willebrand factor type A (vWA) domain